MGIRDNIARYHWQNVIHHLKSLGDPIIQYFSTFVNIQFSVVLSIIICKIKETYIQRLNNYSNRRGKQYSFHAILFCRTPISLILLFTLS